VLCPFYVNFPQIHKQLTFNLVFRASVEMKFLVTFLKEILCFIWKKDAVPQTEGSKGEKKANQLFLVV